MNEILSIKLCALRSARIFPNIGIFFDPTEGVLGKITIPRRLFLIKRRKKILLVITKRRYEYVADLLGFESLGTENLLFESYQAGEYVLHDFEEIFKFVVENEPEEHYLKILKVRYNRLDIACSEDLSSPVDIFGEDLVSLVNRACCHYIGRRFENSIDVLADNDGEMFGNDLLELISDICLLAPSIDNNLRNRLLSDAVGIYGQDLVDLICEKSREIYRHIYFRFSPNLLLQSLLSDERPSPRIFDY